ncbi:hypothetical protein NP233_g9688 [Leucocoprinus birnbaumii]|uniref:Uncharacterized protein n=1 Tax=Leucocoprinus birnbaumii TaxID=56174 RepID=A0AAD5VKM8_9AGAR|nr:hypothetical protein NP233_g9688 [Leucocoprinus birnbaumii]
MHVPSTTGPGYVFPAGGQQITLGDINFMEYNHAIPIYNPLLASLSIIYENVISLLLTLVIFNIVLHLLIPIILLIGALTLPSTLTIVPCNLPLSQATTIVDNEDAPTIEINSLFLHSSITSPSSTASNPPTPRSSPSIITKDEGDPIQGVAVLFLTDKDAEGSIIDFDMTEQEGQA